MCVWVLVRNNYLPISTNKYKKNEAKSDTLKAIMCAKVFTVWTVSTKKGLGKFSTFIAKWINRANLGLESNRILALILEVINFAKNYKEPIKPNINH